MTCGAKLAAEDFMALISVFPHGGDRSLVKGDLADLARTLMGWARFSALPMWSSAGVSAEGWFHESIDLNGRPHTPFRRARVQPRQAYSLCLGGALGWSGPWRALSERAMDLFQVTNGLETGGYRTRLTASGSPLDDTVLNYDLAFVLMARAALRQAETARPLLAFLDSRADSAGGYREADHRPFQSNATMHLFEAFLAWDEVEPGTLWRDRADGLAQLAIDRLIDDQGGFIREAYDKDWRPAAEPDGEAVEPGHQFEWAYLLQTWAARRGDATGTETARRLFDAGRRGVDPVRNVAIDELDSRLTPVRRTARLWPQTERLKASLALALAEPDPIMLDESRSALASVLAYLRPEGLWGDVMDEGGQIVPTPAPASTLYHIMTAVDQVAAASRKLSVFDEPLDLR